MKKFFVIFIIIVGIRMIIKGIYGFFSFELQPISSSNCAYDLGHNLGYIFDKIGKIGIVF